MVEVVNDFRLAKSRYTLQQICPHGRNLSKFVGDTLTHTGYNRIMWCMDNYLLKNIKTNISQVQGRACYSHPSTGCLRIPDQTVSSGWCQSGGSTYTSTAHSTALTSWNPPLQQQGLPALSGPYAIINITILCFRPLFKIPSKVNIYKALNNKSVCTKIFTHKHK